MKLNTPERMLFALLRTALWEQPIDTVPFAGVTAADWTTCHHLAIRQGVQAIAFDGIATLPDTLQPPRPQKLGWAASVGGIEQQYSHYLATAAALVRFYRENALSIMLLKGLGLAADYPIPAHRESGDMDIWLFGQYDKGNRLMEQQGIRVDKHGRKHDFFYFRGVPIENHRTFLNVTLFKTDRLLEKALNRALSERKYGELPLPGNEHLALPPAMFNAIFLSRHMCVHFANRLVIRHLCDWSRFLYVHRGRYDKEEFISLLRKTRMLPVVRIFTELCIEQLGMPPECSPFPDDTSPVALKQRIFYDILREAPERLPEGQSAFRIIIFKWRRLMANRWKHKLVHRQSFLWRVLVSSISHLLYPETILKLK